MGSLNKPIELSVDDSMEMLAKMVESNKSDSIKSLQEFNSDKSLENSPDQHSKTSKK
jgi:hypothetical protein